MTDPVEKIIPTLKAIYGQADEWGGTPAKEWVENVSRYTAEEIIAAILPDQQAFTDLLDLNISAAEMTQWATNVPDVKDTWDKKLKERRQRLIELVYGEQQ